MAIHNATKLLPLTNQTKLTLTITLTLTNIITVISEATTKLSEAVHGTVNNLQCAKVAQAMLSAVSEKLNASTKQLADIRHEKKIDEKRRKLEWTAADKKRTAGSVVSHTMSDPAAKK